MRIRYLCRHPFIYALLFLLASCTSELDFFGNNGESGETAKIPIDLRTKLGAEDKATVSKVRVIIFSTRSSIPEGPKVLVVNEMIDVNNNAKIETYIGYNDIYVIGNEPTDLASIKTPQELKTILIPTRNDAKAENAVLFKQLLNVRIKNRQEIYIEGKPEAVSRLEIKLQHVMAKLNVNFDLSTELIGTDGKPTKVFFDFKSMEIINIPKHSSLIPQIYKISQGYTDNRRFDLTNKNNSTENNHFQWSSGDIYLPEHLIDNDTHRTLLHIKGEANKIAYTYIVPIGDAMGSQNSNSAEKNEEKWNITRNHHYILNIKAVTRDTELLETSASVAEWSENDVPIEISGPNFITLIKQEVDIKSVRFPSYIGFISNSEIRIELPEGLKPNQVNIDLHYDRKEENRTSGRIAVRRGNWFTGSNTSTVIKVISGTASANLKLNFSRTQSVKMSGGARVNWAFAMGYPPEANHQAAGYYNRNLYKQAEKLNINTGCNNYYSGDPNSPTTGKGCWRLATIAENQQWIGDFWCIEEYGPQPSSRAHAAGKYLSGKPYLGDNTKTETYSYVCVLDIRPPELADFIVSDQDEMNISRDNAETICTSLGSGWKLPDGKEMEYVFNNAGTNGLPNNFFAESYWGKNNDGTFIVATMRDPSGQGTTDEMIGKRHAVRCLKSRY